MFKGNIFWMIIKTNNFYLKTRYKYLFSCLSTSFKKKTPYIELQTHCSKKLNRKERDSSF